MSVVEITSGGQLQQLISQKPHTIAVVDFYATWCGPCIAAAPRFAAMAQQYVSSSGPVHVVFCKIDVDRNSELQAKYEIRAMPTFKILFDGHVEDTITGADLGAVESKLGMLIQYAKSKAQPVAAAPSSASSAPQDIYPTGEPVSPLGRLFIELQRAIEVSNAATASAGGGSTTKSTTPICERIFQFLVTKSDPVPGKAVMPFGLPLLAYFLSDSYFSPQAMEVFLTHVVSIQGKLDANHFGNSPWAVTDGSSGFSRFSSKGGVLSLFSIVGNLTSFVTSALGKETWNINDSANFQLNNQRGPLPPGIQAPTKKEHYDGKYHRVVRRMLGVPTFQRVLTNPGSFPLHSNAAAASAASADNDDNDATNSKSNASMAAALVDMLSPHPLFLPTGSITTCQPKSGGKLMERQSILGALLSPGIFPSGGMTANLLPLYLGQLFNPARPIEAEIAGVKADVHARMSSHFEMTFPILRELLSKKSFLGRSAVLQWISAFLTANSAFGKEMHDKYDTASHSAMLVLMHVLVELGLPVVSSKNFELSIPAAYLLDLNADLPAVLGGADGEDGPLYADGINIRPESAFHLESPSSKKSGTSEESEESAGATAKKVAKPEEVTHSGAPLEELRRRLNQRSLVHFSSTSNKPTDVERVEHLVIPALSKAGAADPDSTTILPQVPSNLVTPSAATLAACAELSALIHQSGSGDAEVEGGDAASALDSEALHKLLYTDIEANVGVQTHAPKVHLFYFALRAISLAQTPLLLNIKTWKRHLEYPQVDNRQKQFLRQRIELSSAMLTCPALSLKTIRFVNGVSKWLLHILLQGDMNKGNSTTGVPTVPAETWKYLPQVIFDTIFTTLELVTSFEIAKVEHSDINDILGLMLLLMGNLSLFPKAHSHIPFPTIILKFLEQPHMRDMLTRHPWFQSQIIMGCIRTYMAMEGCGYDRVPARYYISCILRILLKDDGLAYAARPLLEDVSNGIMERFTHMVTSEANSAIDTILENLIKMRKLEEAGDGPNSSTSGASSPTSPAAVGGRGGAAGGRGRGGRGRRNDGDNDDSSEEEEDTDQQGGGGEESYAQLGSGLKQSLFLFSATIDAFKTLSEQYPKGILQNLVAQQIANMLARSLIKLAGPNSKELKISNPDQYNFKPREILTNIVECLVRFKHEETFIRLVFSGAAAESPPDGKTLFYAIDNMLNPSRPLVFGMAASDLASIKEQLLTASKDVLSEDELWGEDPPEFALCALMQTPLRNPIALPTSGDDLTFVEGDVIHHALLKEEQNPFTRAKLTTAELEEFNATPRVQEALVKLKADIAEYLVQRRAELGR